MSVLGGDPAHPTPDTFDRDGFLVQSGGLGLTKREAFAMAAMQGALASCAGTADYPSTDAIADWSVRYADAVLAKLARAAA